ncbi:hypothetical protein PMZ80_003639 [Knufia obscura]|uniref:Macro domain-containing protein n=1 Tax=Knufia obscura TaxID=1635080 RepID=A0ABR0RVT6_9EURO|nr:hypothetical protein PMZ80_003639 [Knufia obscura]
MASLKKLASIPSLTQLYRSGRILPTTSSNGQAANQEKNDKICTIQYDITKLEVDAIVNAANTSLLGSAKITDAYNLPCKKVIHTVGPVYDSQQKSEPLLRGCYRTALELAAQNDCKSIAFSAISTGIYGYPSDEAAETALDEVKTFLNKDEGQKIEKVIFCNFMQKDVDAYDDAMPHIFPPTEDDKTQKVRSLWDTSSDSETENEVNSQKKAPAAHDSRHKSTSSNQGTVAGVETKTDDGNDQSSKHTTERRRGSTSDAASTADNRSSASTGSGDGASVEPDDSETRGRPEPSESRVNNEARSRGPSYNPRSRSWWDSCNPRWSLCDPTTSVWICNSVQPLSEGIKVGSENNVHLENVQGSEAPMGVKEQTVLTPRTSDKAQQADLSSLTPAATLSDIEIKVHDALRGTRENLLSTLTKTREDCAQLTKKYDEMQLSNKTLGDEVDSLGFGLTDRG